MQRRSGLLTLHLRRRSNTAGELKNGVSKPASQHGLKCRRNTDKPTGSSRTMEADLDGVQSHAIHGGIFSKVASTLGTLRYGPARSGEGAYCVTASKGEKDGSKQDK
jgi:hypothetical protein